MGARCRAIAISSVIVSQAGPIAGRRLSPNLLRAVIVMAGVAGPDEGAGFLEEDGQRDQDDEEVRVRQEGETDPQQGQDGEHESDRGEDPTEPGDCIRSLHLSSVGRRGENVFADSAASASPERGRPARGDRAVRGRIQSDRAAEWLARFAGRVLIVINERHLICFDLKGGWRSAGNNGYRAAEVDCNPDCNADGLQ